ncbi:MAG: dienelactone hydrolase family protein [Pseudomonadota bacterium]
MVLGTSGCGSESETEAGSPVVSTTPAVKAPVQSEEPAASTSRPATGVMFAYAEVEGKLARGYFSYPDDMSEPLPALLLIHDWYGLDDTMRALSDRIASLGYVVFAVDLYEGKTGSKPADTREQSVRLLERPALAEQNIEQALEFMEKSAGSPRIAVQGFGSGGLLALNTAMRYPDKINALIVVQGQTINDEETLRSLGMPVLGIFGSGDRSISTDQVKAFGDALKAANITHEMRLYPNASSGFMIPGSNNYNEKQAENAFGVLREFLSMNLASQP